MQLTGWKIRLLLGWGFGLPGLFGLLATGGLAVYEANFLTRSVEVKGTVIANVEAPPSNNSDDLNSSQPALCPQVRYTSEDGIPRTVTSSACEWPAAFPIGSTVEVHYLRGHPDDGQIDSFFAKWGAVFIAGILTALFLPAGLFLLLRLWSQGFSLDPMGFWD